MQQRVVWQRGGRAPKQSHLRGRTRLPAKAEAALTAALVELIFDDEDEDYGGDIDQPLPQTAGDEESAGSG